jgi:cytochrome c-type biogenesis protein CcmH/NrfF
VHHDTHGLVVANAPRLGMRTFDLRLWVAPIAVLGVGLTIWLRYYAKRFAVEGARGESSSGRSQPEPSNEKVRCDRGLGVVEDHERKR